MEIALVILHADPARGGAERYTADLAAALAARDHRVAILANDFGPPIQGVKFVPLPNKARSRAAQFARFVNSLRAHLSATNYDVVHTMLPAPICDVYHPHAGLAAEAIREGHLKHAGHIAQIASKLGNRLNQRRQLFAKAENYLLKSRQPPVVLCLSEYVKQTVRRYYDLPENRLATLFNAVDLTRFDPTLRDRKKDRRDLKIEDSQTAALMVAQDFARKGLKQTIQAIQIIGNRDLHLFVIGRDKAASYERQAKEAGIAKQIHFIGQVADPRPYYNAADFLVMPTSHDPCSLAVLESLAMGLPVISTVFNGACEIMQNSTHGFVLKNPKDSDALAGAMRQLLDPARRGAMREACLKLRPKLSFESHLDRLLAIYASCKSLSQTSTAR